MNKKILIVLLLSSFTYLTCGRDISYKERDKILEKAYTDIKSENEAIVIRGLRQIKKYPTVPSFYKTISLWEKDVSRNVEDVIIYTLRNFEIFNYDSSRIKEIFYKNYNVNSSKEKKMKLIRLLENTDVEIKDELISRIKKEMN